MIAQELEVSLHMAFVEARQQRHEFITVEHLLLALLDNPSAAEGAAARARPTSTTCGLAGQFHQRQHPRWLAPMRWTPSPRWASSA